MRPLGNGGDVEAPRRRVTVVRHGETEWSASGRHTGRTDVRLTEHGRHDATTVGDRLRAQRFDRVWTSPLSRAADTAAVAGFGDVAEPMDDLVEWDYGSTRGRGRARIPEDARHDSMQLGELTAPLASLGGG